MSPPRRRRISPRYFENRTSSRSAAVLRWLAPSIFNVGKANFDFLEEHLSSLNIHSRGSPHPRMGPISSPARRSPSPRSPVQQKYSFPSYRTGNSPFRSLSPSENNPADGPPPPVLRLGYSLAILRYACPIWQVGWEHGMHSRPLRVLRERSSSRCPGPWPRPGCGRGGRGEQYTSTEPPTLDWIFNRSSR